MELNASRLINTLLSLIIPDIIIKSAVLPGLIHDSLLVRHESLSLLLAMISQLKIICSILKDFHKTFVVQNQITDFILRTIPNLEIIFEVWNLAFEANANTINLENAENIHNPDLLDHLDIILSVLHSYKDICPELLDSSMNLQPNILLSSLNDLQNGEEEDGRVKTKVNCMKVKAIQFLLALDSSIFAPREKTFKKALSFLTSLIHQTASSESYNATRMLLNSTGLFETCENEVDIWISGFSMITDSEERKELTHWFMSILKSCIKHTDKYINSITQAEEALNDHVAGLDVKAEDIINELFDKANNNPNPCKEFVESFLINGKLNFDAKRDNIINYSLDKLNEENSKVAIKSTDKYMMQRNERMNNFEEVKKMENEINRLLDKVNPNNFFSNTNGYSLLLNKVSSVSMATTINEVANFDRKKTDAVIDHSSNKFSKENLNFYKMQACTSVSPLLCCAFEKIKAGNYSTVILNYLSYVTIHTLHYQIVPDVLVHMAIDLTDLPIHKHLQSWSSNEQPIPLKNKLLCLKLLHKLSNKLLMNSKIDVTKLFKLSGDEYSCCFNYSDEKITIKHSLSSHDIKALLKMIVFYLAQLTQRGILQQIQNENCKMLLISLLNIARSINQKSIFEENVKCIFTHPILLHYFSPFCREALKDSTKDMITQTILELCEVVVSFFEKRDDTHNIFFAFRNKFLAQLGSIIEKVPSEVCSNNCDIALLKVLQLRAEDIASLLLALTKLEKTAFISNDKRDLSTFGYMVPILLNMYCSKDSKSEHDQCATLNEQFVKRLSLHLVYLKSNKIQCVERWEQALAKYLSIFPHNIAGINADTFALLLTKGITASTIQLIAILISRNIRLIPSLMKYLLKMENVKQGDIVFPILGSNLKFKWTERFLQSLYKSYSGDIAAYLIEPQNPVPWIEENTTAIAYLIENTFDRPLCEKTCESISQNGDKLDMVSVYFVQLLESLYKRYANLITVQEKPLTDLILILLHVMTSTLKKESKNMEKIKVLCEKLDSTMVCLKKNKHDFTFSSLSKSYSWPQFTRFSLKLGLKDAKDDEIQSNILRNLSNLCDIAYEDDKNDEYTKTLFEMTTSHSEFVNIMLGSSIVKGKFSMISIIREEILNKECNINSRSFIKIAFDALKH